MYMRIIHKYKILLAVFAVIVPILAYAAPAHADPVYDPNNLIMDSLFTDSNTMSISDIQNFLNSKNSGLKNYSDVENCSSIKTPYSFNYYPHCGASVSAATIIYDASRAYGINPQAILATLQKEQSLVTTPNPTQSQINCAMGYSSCSGFSGFFTQVDNGAWQFRTYIELMSGRNWWGYTPVSYPCKDATSLYSNGLYPNNVVTFYNPGGSARTIKIANAATAALYCYTPHVGPYSQTGYSGSYNFVINFENWFGPTISPTSNLVLSDGIYRLNTPSGKSLDIAGGSTSDGAQVQIWSQNSTGAQNWQVTSTGSGFYTLMNPASGKFLDVNGAGMGNGTRVDIYSGNGSCAQKWAIVTSGDGYNLYSACSGRVLDVVGGTYNTDGTRVQIWDKNGGDAQRWKFAVVTPVVNTGTYRLNVPSGKSLDIAGGSTSDGAQVQIWSQNSTGAQNWQVTSTGSGFYTLMNPASGKFLDVNGAGMGNGTRVDIYSGNGSCAQKWAIVPTGDGFYLRSACSSRVLDVSLGAINNDGSRVQIWDRNGTDAQRWKFVLKT